MQYFRLIESTEEMQRDQHLLSISVPLRALLKPSYLSEKLPERLSPGLQKAITLASQSL
jgi:hypothetical protein